MKTFTIKLYALLALLLFGTMQQIHAQKWTGTWNTNLGEVKIVEHPNGNVTFGIGDYSFGGKTTKNAANMGQTVTGNYFVSPRSNSPQGAKPVDYDKYGERGTFTLTSDKTGQSFKGEWKNNADANKKGPINGTIIYEVSNSTNDDIKVVTNQRNVSQEDLKDRKVDVSGADLKAPVPWVGTWTSGNDKWKIIQRSAKGIQTKRSHINKDGHTIESDMSASQTGISKDGKTIYYKGTCTDRNRTTKKTVSVPIDLETSATNYNIIKTIVDYTYRKSNPAVYKAEHFTLKRISHDRPNMNTYD